MIGRRLRAAAGWAGLGLLAAGILTAWVLPFRAWIGNLLLALSTPFLVAHLLWNWERVKFFSRRRASRYGANALLYTLAVAGILVIANYLAARHDLRWDSTEEGLHSLSPQSSRVLASLDRDVTVTAFLPAGHPGRVRAEDLLSLMEAAAGGHLKWEIVDPVAQPDRATRQEFSRPGVLFQSGEASSRTYEVSESAFMNSLLEAVRGEKPRVCFTTGHGERNTDDDSQRGASTAATALQHERYDVGRVDVLEVSDLAGLCDVVVVAGPSESFQEGEVARLGPFLEKGKGVLLMLEPEVDAGLGSLLQRYGVKIRDDQVVERSVARGFGNLNPISTDYAMHPITESLARTRIVTIFSNARSIEIGDRVVYRPELDVICLVKTSARSSYAESTPGVLLFDPSQDRAGPICLGVASVLDPHKEPVLEGRQPPAPDAPTQRLVVLGDADFAANFYFGLGGNGNLFLNSIGWLSRRGELLDIRTTERAPRTVVVRQEQGRLILAVCVLGLPLILLVGGTAVWIQRRRL